MAGETLSEVVVNLSGGFNAVPPHQESRSTSTATRSATTTCAACSINGQLIKEPAEREVVHSIPVGYSIDGSRGIRDPRGMFGQTLGVNMHVVTAQQPARCGI